MTRYKIYEHPECGMEAVKVGLSWPAFFLGAIWMLVKGLWKMAGLWVVLFLGLIYAQDLLYKAESDESWWMTAIFMVSAGHLILTVIPTIWGNQWRSIRLEEAGYRLIDERDAISTHVAAGGHSNIFTKLPRTNRLAIVSYWLALLGLITLGLYVKYTLEFPPPIPVGHYSPLMGPAALLILGILLLVAILMILSVLIGVASLLQSLWRKRLEEGWYLALPGVIVVTIIFLYEYMLIHPAMEEIAARLKEQDANRQNSTEPSVKEEQSTRNDLGNSIAPVEQIEIAKMEQDAEQGDVYAQSFLGSWYYKKGNYKSAFKWLEKAAMSEEQQDASVSLGLMDVRVLLGLMYEEGLGTHSDINIAMAWYQKAANQDSAWGATFLGALYAKGKGVPQDYQKALSLWLRAAKQGNNRAQGNLGYLYEAGLGVPQNYVEAVKWYRLAAEGGWWRGQLDLARIYFEGHGVKRDYSEAIKWWRKAADDDQPEAAENLGYMYEKGLGTQQDDMQAARWYRLAADQGSPKAQWHLSILYMKGAGVPQDFIQAYMWAELSTRQGYPQGKVHRDLLLRNRMTPTEIAEAEQLANNWKPVTGKWNYLYLQK